MTDHPPNFRLLPSFSHQELGPDGVFLNPVSGLHYILHLFDSTEAALQSAYLGTDQQLLLIRESVRQNSDRVTFLESRHGGLQRQVDLKTATDGELSDWMLNRAEEDWLVVKGLPRLSGANWQDAARRQVADTIKLALHVNRTNVNFEVMYVSNPFRFQTNRQNLYNVRMDSVGSSKRIREIFSGFFRRVRPVALPPPLKGVSIRNKISPDTKIRISILHQLGSIFQESTRGASYKVSGFDSRPLLVTFPPSGSADRQRTYNFLQAVTHLPANFTDEHLIRIFSVVSNQQQGRLQSLFVVIHDDQRDRCLELVKQQRASGHAPGSHPGGPGGHPSASAATASLSGAVSGAGSGMDLAALPHSSARAVTFSDLQLAPPPPPADCSVQVNPEQEASGGSKSRPRSAERSITPDVAVKEKDKSKVKDKDKQRDKSSGSRQRSEERSVSPDVSVKEKDTTKVKSRGKESDKARDRDQEKDRSRSSKGVRRRRSSSSSRERDRDRKRTKKSKRRHRSPSSSSGSSASGSGSSSGSDSHHRNRRSRSRSKGRSSPRTRER